MVYLKVIYFNIIVLIGLLIVLEIGAGAGRLLIAKEFYLPKFFMPEWRVKGLRSPSHPCNEMRSDVLLDHVTNRPDLCKPKGGATMGEYTVYNISDKNKPVLLTLGGSTTSGFYQYISDGETYPKYLANLAKDHFYTLNGGVGGYGSLQELYKFVRDGSRIANLDVVISLSGINDIPDYHGLNDIRKYKYPFLTENQYLMNEKQKWINMRIAGTWVYNNISYRMSILLPNLYSLVWYFSNFTPQLNDKELQSNEGEIFLAVDAAERWEKNMQRLNTLVKLEGATFYLFLQPVIGLLGPQSVVPSGSKDEIILNKVLTKQKDTIEATRSLYSKLKIKCEKMAFCFDISDEVPPTGEMYNDTRHHNAKGNSILAKVIWDIILEEKMRRQK